METIKLIKHTFKNNIIDVNKVTYIAQEIPQSSFETIALFFTTETGGLLEDWWIEFLEKESEALMKGNTILVKKNGKYAYVSQAIFEQEDPEAFKIKIDNFIEIIKKWKQLSQIQPDQIMIIKDGEHIKIIGTSAQTHDS